MMSLWRRVVRLLKQKVHALVQRADDPVEALDFLDAEYLRDLGRMRKHIASVCAEEKRLQFEMVRLHEQECGAEQLASELIQAREEDAAQAAFARAARSREHRSEIERAYAAVCERRKELERIGEEMRLRLEALRVHRQTARAETVAARALIAAREWMLPIGAAGIAREESLEHAHEALSQLRCRSQALSQLQS